jgi:hypothetical protein
VFNERVQQTQKDLVEAEEERARVLALAEIGQAPTAQAAIVSTSRLTRRPAEGNSMLPPPPPPAKRKLKAKAKAKGQGRRRRAESEEDGDEPDSRAASQSKTKKAKLDDNEDLVGGSRVSVSTTAAGSSAKSNSGAGTPIKIKQSQVAEDDQTYSADLARLLVSTHGKIFPSIKSILSGTSVKRELGGVWVLSCFA